MAAGQMQARGGSSDDLEWGVDLRALVEHKTHGPAEKVVVIAKRQVSKLHVIQDAGLISVASADFQVLCGDARQADKQSVNMCSPWQCLNRPCESESL